MALKDEINSAIAMHSIWKARLDRCVETGSFDTPVDVVARDNECYFGKWLYGVTLTPAIRASENYQRVQACHARFHQVAAKVVELSLAGKKRDAANLMALNGEYTQVTSELIRELKAWAQKTA